MSFKKKKENNSSIISNVSFTADTNMLKALFYSNFPLFPTSSQPTEPFLPFPLPPDFAKESLHFLIYSSLLSHIIFLPPWVYLSISQSPMVSFQMTSSNFLNIRYFCSFILLLRLLRNHTHMKIL